MKVKTIFFVLIFGMLAQIASAAFSTPYLQDNVLKLVEGQDYNFEIVFQNTANESTIMNFQVLTGNEWFTPDNLSVNVSANNYDTRQSTVIRIPEGMNFEYNTPYDVEYSVSTGDKGGGGMVPVTSQIKKKFQIVVPKEIPMVTTEATEPTEDTKRRPDAVTWVVVIGLIGMIMGYMIWSSYKEKPPKKEDEVVGNKENG